MSCRLNKIDAQEVIVNLAKKQHLRAEYKSVNPLGKIPCYTEDGFSLAESGAILRYLAATNEVPDHWYPGRFQKIFRKAGLPFLF